MKINDKCDLNYASFISIWQVGILLRAFYRQFSIYISVTKNTLVQEKTHEIMYKCRSLNYFFDTLFLLSG